MKNTHKRPVAWAIAILSIVCSAILWAFVFSAFQVEKPYQREEFIDVFDATIRADGRTVQDEPNEKYHAAAPDKTDENVEIYPVSENVPAKNSETDSELVQWGLSRSFTISIPEIRLRATVLVPSRKFWDAHKWDMLEKQMQVGLRYGAVQYPHSSLPGKNGSLIIAGHSSPPTEEAEKGGYGQLFARLGELVPGDAIIITYKGKTITYEVEDAEIVPPGQTSILEQQEDEGILKLITCYPVGTTRDRLVVIAKLST